MTLTPDQIAELRLPWKAIYARDLYAHADDLPYFVVDSAGWYRAECGSMSDMDAIIAAVNALGEH